MKPRDKQLIELAHFAMHSVLVKPKLDAKFEEFNRANIQLNNFMNKMRDIDAKAITPEFGALITLFQKEVDTLINSPTFKNESKKALETKNKLQKVVIKARETLKKVENRGPWSLRGVTPNDLEFYDNKITAALEALINQKQEWFYYDNLERLQLQLKRLENLVNTPVKETEPERSPPPLESMEYDYESDLETLEINYFPSTPSPKTNKPEKFIDLKEQEKLLEKTEHTVEIFKKSAKKDAKAMDLIYECYNKLKHTEQDASDIQALKFLKKIINQYTSGMLPLVDVWKKNMEEAKPIRVIAEIEQNSRFFSKNPPRAAVSKKEQQITQYELALQNKSFRKLVNKLEDKNVIKTEKISREGLRVDLVKKG